MAHAYNTYVGSLVGWVSVELSADRLNTQDLLSARIQSQVAASVATGIANARAQIEAAK